MKLALRLICLLLASLLAPSLVVAQSQSDAELAKRRAEERLTFQSGDPWTPRINVNADAAMVYGIGPRMPGLVTSWRDHGYIVDLMTGVAFTFFLVWGVAAPLFIPHHRPHSRFS